MRSLMSISGMTQPYYCNFGVSKQCLNKETKALHRLKRNIFLIEISKHRKTIVKF